MNTSSYWFKATVRDPSSPLGPGYHKGQKVGVRKYKVRGIEGGQWFTYKNEDGSDRELFQVYPGYGYAVRSALTADEIRKTLDVTLVKIEDQDDFNRRFQWEVSR